MNKFEFPYKTLDWMINKVGNIEDKFLYTEYENLYIKLKEIKKLNNIHKMNRWFGYYQRVGQDLKVWTLDEIIKKVRKEKEYFENGINKIDLERILKNEYRLSDKNYLEYLKYKVKIDCKICENRQSDNIDMIEYDHPCYNCLGSCYEAEMLYMHKENNFKSKEKEENMEKYIEFMGDKYHG